MLKTSGEGVTVADVPGDSSMISTLPVPLPLILAGVHLQGHHRPAAIEEAIACERVTRK